MKSIIFIGYHTADAIKPAKKMGYTTILLNPELPPDSPFDKVYITDLNNPKSIIKNLKKVKNVSGVITNMEKYTPQQAFVAQHYGIPTTPAETVLAGRNKNSLRKLFGNSRLNIDAKLVKTLAQAVKVAKELRYPVLIKNTVGAKGRYIKKVNNETELKKHFNEIKKGIKSQPDEYTADLTKFFPNQDYPSPKEYLLIEKFIEGIQVTVVTFINDNSIKHIPILCRVITAGEAGIDDSYLLTRKIPFRVSKKVEKKIWAAGEEAALALKAKRCGTHTELLVTSDGQVKILEITTRLGGFRQQMFKAAYGIDLYKILTEIAVGKTPQINLKLKKTITVVEKFHSHSGTIKEIKGLDEIIPKVLHFKQHKFVGDKIGPASKGFRAICSFMVKGSEKKALKYLNRIEIKRK